MLEVDFRYFPIAVFTINADQILEANDNALRIFGLEKLNFPTDLNVFFPESVLRVLRLKIKDINDKKSHYAPFQEFILYHETRGYFSVEIALMSVKKHQSRRIALLMQQSSFFQQAYPKFQDILLENTSDMFFLTDMDGNILLASKSASVYHGYSTNEMQRISFSELFLENHVFEEIKQKVSSDGKYTCVLRKKRKNGEHFFVSSNFILIQGENLEFSFILSIERDISDIVEYQRLLFKHIKDQTILKDVLEIYLKARNYHEALTSLLEKLKDHFKIIGIEVMEDERCIENLGNKTEFSKQIVFFSPLDSKNIVFRVFVPAKENLAESEEIIFYTFSNLFNAMERFKIIDLLKKEKERAETADRLKSEFLTNMSHEIRTPLNGITGFLHLLENTVLSSEQQEYVNAIHISSHRLLSLMDHIMDLSRIESGEAFLEVKEFNPVFFLHEMGQVYKLKALEKGLEFDEILEELPEKIFSDYLKLSQIVSNLLENAVKFTDQGKITLRAGFSENSLWIRIEDTGIGIPEEKQTLIFNKFVQLDGSHTRKYGGTGLGLAIVKSLAGILKVSMELKSRQGQGTVFILKIPEMI